MTDLIYHPLLRWTGYAIGVSTLLVGMALLGLVAALVASGVVLALPLMLGGAWLQQRLWRQPALAVLPRR